jgi:succinate dehydrogenase / fumarate reductase iron-sulfur subunit
MGPSQATPPRVINFRLLRYDPDRDAAPRWQTQSLPVSAGMTVLEALHALKHEQDPTLTWRSSCRMGICGSCGMYINGLPRLACQTQVLHLNTDTVEIAPLPNYPNVKDLVPDLQPLFAHHQAVRPYVIAVNAQEQNEPTGEYCQTPAEREYYGQFSLCIKCGLCLSACPTVATDAEFLGPQPLAQAYRYIVDNRDSGLEQRLETLDALHGPFQCHLAGACTEACPKGVDPAMAIQLLKRTLSLNALGLRRPSRAPRIMPLPSEYVANDRIPKPPPRTVTAQSAGTGD